MSVNVYDPVNDKLIPVAGATLYADTPIGAIQAFDSTDIPSSFLEFKGQTVNRADYPDLWAHIVKNSLFGEGKFYGVGDGATTFTLADLRETSLKGYGETSRSVGAHVKSGGLGIGEFIDDQLQNITGTFEARATSYLGNPIFTDPTGAFELYTGGSSNIDTLEQTSTMGATRGLKFDASNVVRAGTTTEVKAVGVVWAVKAKQTGLPIDLQQQMESYIIERSIPVSYPKTPSTGITAVDFTGYIKSGNVITVILGQLVPSSNLGPFAPLLEGLPKPPQVIPFMTSIGYCFIDSNGVVLTGRATSVSAGATIDGTFTYTV